MDNENIQKVRVEHHHIWGLLWIACRLFTQSDSCTLRLAEAFLRSCPGRITSARI